MNMFFLRNLHVKQHSNILDAFAVENLKKYGLEISFSVTKKLPQFAVTAITYFFLGLWSLAKDFFYHSGNGRFLKCITTTSN